MWDAEIELVLQRVAANVRRWRERRLLTQERLAQEAQLDLRTIQRIERGTMNMRVGVLLSLAHALDTIPGALFRTAKLAPAQRGRPKERRAGERKRESKRVTR